jgi:hypothetical protein
MLKTEFEFYEILASRMLYPYLSRVRNYTEKDKLQAENILDILQIKQVRNEIYKRTKSERKTLFFSILLFIDLNIIVYDLTEDTQSLVKPYAHFMFIVST